MTPEQIDAEAKRYVEEHPFRGKAKIVLLIRCRYPRIQPSDLIVRRL